MMRRARIAPTFSPTFRSAAGLNNAGNTARNGTPGAGAQTAVGCRVSALSWRKSSLSRESSVPDIR